MLRCDDIQSLLSLFVDHGDDALPPKEVALVRAHLAQCVVCEGLVSDLMRLRETARALGPISPPDHVWLEIAGQIHLANESAGIVKPRVSHRSEIWQWAALAAALIIVTLGIYVVRIARPAAGQSTTGNVSASGSVEGVAQELDLALQHYQNAITDLEAIRKDGATSIDPVVGAAVDRNLSAIDRAIAESRRALTDDPESEPARESLIEALGQKVTVLQATVSLINQMRQDRDTGAAPAAGSIGRKS